MSEELDLAPNNLCIPEDAFEKFQAVSMYQEKQYIVLPKSVPPNAKSPDSKAVSSQPVDNEIVVSSENVLRSPLNSIEIDRSAEKSLLHGSKAGSTTNDSASKSRQSRRNSNRRINYNYDSDMVISSSEFGSATIKAPTTDSTTDRKRGRKPKKDSPEEFPAEVSQKIQNPDISSTPFSSDLDTSDTNAGPRKKRGRPRKLDEESLSENAIIDRKISIAPSTDNNRTDESTTTTQRRGRQRRSKVNSIQAITQNESERQEPILVSEEPPQAIAATEQPNATTVANKPTKSKLPKATSKQTKTSTVKSKQSKLKQENEQINLTSEDRNLASELAQPAAEQSNALEQPSSDDLIQLSDLDIVEVSNSNDTSKINKSTEESTGTNIETTDLEDYESKLESESKMLNDNTNDSDLDDDVCLSKLKVAPAQFKRETDGDMKNTSSENVNENPNNPKKRRGRPKRETFGESLSQMIENKLGGDDVGISKSNDDEKNIETITETSDIQVDDIQQSTSGINGIPKKRNTKMPVMADFEYNIDSVIGNDTAETSGISADDSLLTEDPSKRSTRRRVKKFQYEEESDEDPFANIELSDDEPRRGRKTKYYSDDEYVPGQKKGKRQAESSESEDISDADEMIAASEMLTQGRKKSRNNQSPRKKGKKGDEFNPKISDITSLEQTNDIEGCLEPAVIKAHAGEYSKWGTTTEFENFLAKKIQGTNLKIKKVSSVQASTDNNKMDIPVIAADAKRSIEMCTQTASVATTSTGVQTSSLYDGTMKENIALTPKQSEKACSFLNSIVKTTAELGLLMTQKSEDFIKKKINTTHVTDTSKMDYCVKKSFLLFKLAKHNLLQMEEDLAKQYDEFLKKNGLESCIEAPKAIKPTPKKAKNADSDSDCEIVDVAPSPHKKTLQKSNPAKPAFNPKTVFLNKELSIKIAKKSNDTQKPTDTTKLDIKGRHTVWINDTVMVKKVKPTQSFLAQDSRNKKPPDYPITTEMVSDFFKDYFRQKAVNVCAPFVTTDWLSLSRECVCNYFVIKPPQFDADTNNFSENDINGTSSDATVAEPSHDLSDVLAMAKRPVVSSPESLFKLCFCVLKSQLHDDLNQFKEVNHKIRNELTDGQNDPVTLDGQNDPVTLEGQNDPVTLERQNIPVSLFRLCIKTLINSMTTEAETFTKSSESESPSNIIQLTVPSLNTLCYRTIATLLADASDQASEEENELYVNIVSCTEDSNDSSLSRQQEHILPFENNKKELKSLFSLCVQYIQRIQKDVEINKSNILTPQSLKYIAFENVKYLLYASGTVDHQDNATEGLMMINCVNTLSEEAFLNLEQCNTEIPDSSEYPDDFDNDEHLEPDLIDTEDDLAKPSWLSQVQMKELRSCGNNTDQEETQEPQEMDSIIAQIKIEPLDDVTNNAFELALVKSEPIPGPDEMTIIPNVKPEIEEFPAPVQRHSSSSYDMDTFEHFVSSSKLMRGLNEHNTEEIYSQSSERVHRQHEPDYYEENTDALGLLVPHTYETIVIQTAKGSLMESSSDEITTNTKNTSKKVKRKARSKKSEQKLNSKNVLIASVQAPGVGTKEKDKANNNKQIPAPAPVTKEKEKASKNKNAPALPIIEKTSNNEVAMLTRRMKEKIRQEEKKDESTDSESETVAIRLRSRDKKDTTQSTSEPVKEKSKPATTIEPVKEKSKPTTTNEQVKEQSIPATTNEPVKEKSKTATTSEPINEESIPARTSEPINEKVKPAVSSKNKNDEIQCSNVDSTDQIQLEDNVPTFSGFTSIETNEMSNYEKYMKFVYDKVIPGKEEEILKGKENVKDAAAKVKLYEESKDSVISFDEPVELLECEPTMPIFDDGVDVKVPKGPKSPKSKRNKAVTTLTATPEPPKFVDRYGWECYPVDSSDAKLYQNTSIFLEKLPESFVQTYFEYQNIPVKDKSDKEINRLTNLTSLNRSTSLKERKGQNSSKKSARPEKSDHASEENSRPGSGMDSDHYDELMPSDDECSKIEDEEPQPVLRHTENTLAKNSLMDDNESDNGHSPEKITKEVNEDAACLMRPGPKSKKKPFVAKQEGMDLMLTADKMMNKELTLLHAPVVMNDSVKDTPAKGYITRNSKKNVTKVAPTVNKDKGDEDSSSEEEKQWVFTKEKLLKRMGKKETASTDDAKRAKLVSEFIERREGNPGLRKRTSGRPRRSGKKFLEREKQLRVLQRELFGEESNDPTVGKRSGAAWKGRRNIRKVLDKKSLARSTVIANMEEFERKRRLNARTTKLRELLGCEEGVNVLVINDEVCLEYDFEEHRPVVTIHPFFTRVMKAHQYEGVKFMWDACFESLADIEQGHPGGGCILAHCMGLGKTLQVLALLHTVLTHPRVGMTRVLVCCPLSTVLNWVDEIHKWIGPVTNQIKVFELSKLKKTYERAYQLEDWYNGGGIFIIGYELFRSLSTLDPEFDDIRPTIVNKIRTALLDPGPDIVVCDEGHLLKNDCSVLAVAMSRVVTKRRIVLTGTPMQNNLREYYCMVNFVKPNLLGTYAEYSNRFENPIMNGQHRDSVDEDIQLMKARTHILHKVLEGCLQRQEASVLYPYLPKKHEYTVFITLTKCQWDLYKHYLNHYSRQTSKTSVLKDFHILQKIWSHPQVLHNFQTKAQENRNKIKVEKLEDDLAAEDHDEIKEDLVTDLWWLQYLEGGNMLDSLESSNKFLVVFRILDECVALGDKVLIFSTSLFCLDALEYFLKKMNKWSLGQEYYRLDGSVPAEVRQKWCREFNADTNVNTKLFLVSTRAGCLGLNMTSANRVIIMDTSWNPAHDIQSIFRVYRFGQKKDCFIYRLVAMGTMEQKIYERSVTKQAVACRVVDEQQIDRHYNMAELTELYRYDEAGAGVAGGVAVGVRDVALLRVARHAALHAVHEHDSLLRSSEQGLNESERNAAWMQFQQEQTHKQMENKLITNIPKMSLKRIQGGHGYVQSYDLDNIKTEIKSEDASGDFVKHSEVKKKGRGRSARNQIPPEPITGPTEPPNALDVFQEPGTSKGPRRHMDQKHYEDETLVHKITELLMQHDFQNRKGNTEIANLVAKVRKIVKQGYIYQGDTDDPLTASIAKVLLPKQMTMPVLTDIMCESINKSVNTSASLQPESILGTPTNDRKTRAESRSKRKAALAAEKHIDSITQDVIVLDEDVDNTDADFVPDAINKPDKQQTKRKSVSKESTPQVDSESTRSAPSPNCSFEDDNEPSPFQDDEYVEIDPDSPPPPATKPKVGPKAFKEKLQRKYKEITKNMIAPAAKPPTSNISDDDEPLSKQRTTPASNTSDSPAAAAEDEEVIPLPLSLLSNKNFINIVAHTYLNGNPMLDADAATLAAQYSTFKSLKEAEETGKAITSGPIYDIAVKVVGKTLFKRMNGVNVKSSSTVDAASVTIDLKKKMLLLNDHALEDSPNPKSRTRKRKEYHTEQSEPNDMMDTRQSTANHSQDGNVVPVGLIQSASRIPNVAEFTDNECILPDGDDDDDCRIMPPSPHLPEPPPLHPMPRCYRPHPTADPSPPVTLGHILSAKKKRASDAFMPALVSSAPIPLPAPPSQPQIKVNKGKIIITPTSLMCGGNFQVLSTPPKSMSSKQLTHPTICLDSDEDEPPPPKPPAAIPLPAPPAPPPVPISLTVGPSPENRLPKTLNLAPMSAMPMTKPLILQKSTASAAPRFVLLPATSAATSTVTSVHSKKTVTSAPHSIPAPTLAVSAPTKHSESLLRTSSPSIAYSEKLKQARCKPGDIIKISDKGEIEVLQVNKLNNKDGVMSVGPSTSGIKTYAPSQVNKSKPGPSQASKPKPSPSETPKSQSSHSVVTKQKTYQREDTSSKAKPGPLRSRTLSISSSSSDSRPPSPVDNNPLSILKNVVHIQAADDTPRTSQGIKNSTTVKSQKTSVKTDSATPSLKTVLQTKHDTLFKAIRSKTDISSSSSKSDSKSSKVFSGSSSNSKHTDSKISKVPSSSSNVSKSSDTKTSKVLNDLMLKKSLSLKSSKTPEKKPSTPTVTKTVVVTSKPSSHPKGLTQFATVKAGSGASILKTKIEVKKRVSTAEAASTPPKKKMMTLKDFNIDDIDDIIELD